MEKKKLSLLEYIIAIIFAVAIITVTSQIIWRYVFNNSLHWSEELSRFIFLWMIFLGAAVAVKENTHIRIDNLLLRIGGKKRKIMDVFLLCLMMFICGYFVYYGMMFVIGTNNSLSTALGIPINLFVSSALPISSLIAMYYCAKHIAALIKEISA